MVSFERNCQAVALYNIAFPSAINISWPAFNIASDLDFGHLVVSHCCNLHFLDDKWCGASFHVLNIFSQSMNFLLILLINFFLKQKFFTLMKSRLSFFFYGLCLLLYLIRHGIVSLNFTMSCQSRTWVYSFPRQHTHKIMHRLFSVSQLCHMFLEALAVW